MLEKDNLKISIKENIKIVAFINKAIGRIKISNTMISIILTIILTILFGDLISNEIKSIFLSISNIMKKIMMLLLPFLIFPFILNSIFIMNTSGIYLIICVIILVIISNFTSIILAYGASTYIMSYIPLERIFNQTNQELIPYFDINLMSPIKTEIMMSIAFIVGITLKNFNITPIKKIFKDYQNFSMFFFKKYYIPTLPLYIFGSMLKTFHEINIESFLISIGYLVSIILFIQICYISFLFFLGSRFNIYKVLKSIKNTLPASFIAFSSMSSIVAMPLIIESAKKNIGNKNITNITISTCINYHVIGEAIALPMVAIAIYYTYFGNFPEIAIYISFAVFVTLAQFGGVSVPGGTIIILIPFLIKYLNFDDEMISIMIAFSILLDPIGTGINVMGNGAFVMIVDIVYQKIEKIFQSLHKK